MPGSGRVWAALAELLSDTGLVPIQLDSLDGDTESLWAGGDFLEPGDPHEVDGVDVGALLENLWRDAVWADVDDPEAMQWWAPFTLELPGLAWPRWSPPR